ncbi:YkvA family protein [Nocardioides panacihumi]|uniref:YkvA family protein n=1 Tax=Nocardioides panacihumi TaxID=400774 RepID=A0ABN2RH63_9ACTN
MNPWLQVAVTVLAGLLCVWLALVAVLYVAGRRYDDPPRVREILRLIPDVVRLLHRLVKDRSLPRGVRLRVFALIGYLAMPIDLVPDFIPVVGYADDVVIVALTLRSISRVAGVDALDRHWPGTPEGLTALKRLAGL